ncbi:hypothetical protein [Nocardia wallacei]|uniref:hypothetical protein n=1 Tax=Nocardia wallacei TaxID=480035 RepID=UPI00245646C3|nr:hypothetical protein [Nocardia wallacei]
MSILCPDPDGQQFLRWVDAVADEPLHAWIARRQILRAVAVIGRWVPRFGGRVTVGMHGLEVPAEFVLLGGDIAYVPEAAAASRAATPEASAWLSPCADGKVPVVLAHSWRAIAEHHRTRWFSAPVETDCLPRWPSLFKGNAVLTDHDGAQPRPVVRKWCAGQNENAAERAWVGAARSIRMRTRYFRPVFQRDSASSVLADLVSHAAPVTMEVVAGVSLFELAYTLNRVGQQDDVVEEASRVLGEIVCDSLASLAEFRSIADSLVAHLPRVRYPYAEQGAVATRCLEGGPIADADLSGAIDDVRELGARLESDATVSFRDAHLKNRVWVTGESAVELCHRLLGLDTGELRSEIMRCVVDIDFEAAGKDVTAWDDVAHVLFFEMSGLGPLSPTGDAVAACEKWWRPVDSAEALWCTILARSTREACRRLWYAQHMPRTYLRRYSMESTDAFLDLALTALAHVNDFEHLAALMTRLRESDAARGGIPARRHSHIAATHPAD